ncbi:MAG: ATP-dependent Clp protease proteolytic subunit [Oscillospiraceae bacterium]|nr:ATP-dependent Clp protease proteolytic subunit [Oscillospiraceae bacterium]
MPIKEKREIKQPPVLFNKTQEIIKKVEKILGKKMICYWTSYNGGICSSDVIVLYNLFQKIGKSDDVALFIKSRGGDVQVALRIVNIIRTYNKKVTALIPLESASSATLIALGADEIQMGPLAYLTPIDSSLIHNLSPVDEILRRRVGVSQDEIFRIVKSWKENANENHVHPYQELFKYIHPLVIGSIDRSSSLSIKICKEILSYHLKDEVECDRISNLLNSEFPSHEYPITLRGAKKIGLNSIVMDDNINDMLLELNRLYSEMAQKAFTNFDEFNYHDNQILNIHEADGIQLYFQNDKDWNYLKEERRWQILNDESIWRKNEMVNGKMISSTFHIA